MKAGDHVKNFSGELVEVASLSILLGYFRVKPETLARWHRAGFRLLALEVIGTGGRPQIETELRALSRRMRGICARFCNRTRATTTTLERSNHWIRIRRLLAKFSEAEASNHMPPLADFTTCVCRKLDSAILMVKAAKDRS
jgi:hypothetical protein